MFSSSMGNRQEVGGAMAVHRDPITMSCSEFPVIQLSKLKTLELSSLPKIRPPRNIDSSSVPLASTTTTPLYFLGLIGLISKHF